MSAAPSKPCLRVVLCAPRGFCAGVVRAIDVVERALEIYGAPVYVRHEIVHSRTRRRRAQGQGRHLDRGPERSAPGPHPVIFSAHGVAKAVPEEAKTRSLFTIDATCPLVTKVHREAQAHFKRGRRIVLIGHAGHPEVVGTMGQLPPGAVTLVSTVDEVEGLAADGGEIAYVTQTTLSVDDAREIVAARERRFPLIHALRVEDICYHQPPGSGEGRRAGRSDDRRWGLQFLQFDPAARGRRTRGLRRARGRSQSARRALRRCALPTPPGRKPRQRRRPNARLRAPASRSRARRRRARR